MSDSPGGRVPLAFPVFVRDADTPIQHWQSQWHTERVESIARVKQSS